MKRQDGENAVTILVALWLVSSVFCGIATDSLLVIVALVIAYMAGAITGIIAERVGMTKEGRHDS